MLLLIACVNGAALPAVIPSASVPESFVSESAAETEDLETAQTFFDKWDKKHGGFGGYGLGYPPIGYGLGYPSIGYPPIGFGGFGYPVGGLYGGGFGYPPYGYGLGGLGGFGGYGGYGGLGGFGF